MIDDRDPYYIEKERKNAQIVPYLTGMFLFVFFCFVAGLTYEAVRFLIDHLY